MSKMPYTTVDLPPRSNVDLSRTNRTSMAPGLLYPVQVTEVFPADDVTIDLSAVVKTLPLNGPLMGSFKVQFDHFFIPTRLYNRHLHDVASKFKPETIYFPQFDLEMWSNKGGLPDPISRGCHPSSLFHYLGIPELFIYHAENQSSFTKNYRRFNAIPWLGYMEIFRNYYANMQEEFGYIASGVADGDKVKIIPFSLSEIDNMRQSILTYTGPSSFLISAEDYGVCYEAGNSHYPLGGLACRTYLPDRFNSWLNSPNYDAIANTSKVSTVGNSFTLDSLRFANKLNEMLLKTQVAGGRYSDWLQVQYGSSPKSMLEVPRFLGSCSTELTFDDVIQTSASTDSDPLGTLGGRGVAYRPPKKTRAYINEHGYLMTICSLIPRVDYYQGVKSYLRQQKLSDVHLPAMDGIGFQDLLTDDFAAYSTKEDGTYISIGKQPAWTEAMTATNEIHGDFAEDKLMYMTLARRYSYSDTGNVLDASTYINPSMFNYNFADSSLTAQNFWVQMKFDIYVKRAISKRVMPNL